MASKKRKLNYLKAIVIVHGMSELQIVKYITSNLHLNIKPDGKDNGKHSIQITSLMNYLNAGKFKNIKSFLQEYGDIVECQGRGKNIKIINFTLFIIMDTDDCTEQQKEDYISKSIFQGHWLANYIVPIYNITNLEDVMQESGIMTKRIKNDDKGDYYSKIFPINSKPLCNDTVIEVQTLKKKLENSQKKGHTNLNEFIDYCLNNAELKK